MPNIATEKNHSRQSHRVTIPLLIQFNQVTYNCHDWSVTGVGVLDFVTDAPKGTEFDAALILPIKEASLTLKVKVKLENTHDRLSGFSFIAFESKHKRILRHYIEMSIDGRVDNIEDLLSVAAAPVINSPINDALTLSDIEHSTLLKQFKLRSRIYFFAGILLFISIMTTLYYHANYQINSTGIVLGNTQTILTPNEGVVKATFVNSGAHVQTNDPLFHIQDPQKTLLLGNLQVQLEQLKQRIRSIKKTNNVEFDYQPLLALLNARSKQYKNELDAANELFKERTITQHDLNILKERWQQSEVERLKEQQRFISHNSEQQRRLERDKSQFLFPLETQRDQLEQQIELLKQQVEWFVRASDTGKVLALYAMEGQHLKSHEPLALLTNNTLPFIAMRINKEEVNRLKIGQAARILVLDSQQYFDGEVLFIGEQVLTSHEKVAFGETLSTTIVKIILHKPAQLTAFSPVEVWINTSIW